MQTLWSPAVSLRSMVVIIVGWSTAFVTVNGQDSTPVRSASQASPGMEVPLDVPSTQIKRQKAQRSSSAVETRQATEADGTLIPWWEGAEAVALESMDVNPLSFDLTITAGVEYDDNLYLDNDVDGSQGGEASYFGRLTGTANYESGPVTLAVTYTPEYRIYGSGDVEDGFNQSGSFLASYVTGKTTLGMNISISQNDGASVEIGDRVDLFNVNAGLNASYRLSEKTSIGANLSTQIMEYDEFNSFGSYNASLYFDYIFSPKTTAGVSFGYNRSQVEEGANANAANIQGRLSWQISNKLSLQGNAGAEFREFEGGKNIVSPIYSLGAVYALSELTSISLDSYRRNTPSVSEINQSYYSTGLLMSVNQRFMDRFNISLGVGYENAQYESSTDGVDASKDESYIYIRPQITYTIREKLTFSLYYQYSQNDANDDGRSFDRNLIGASVNYTF